MNNDEWPHLSIVIAETGPEARELAARYPDEARRMLREIRKAARRG